MQCISRAAFQQRRDFRQIVKQGVGRGLIKSIPLVALGQHAHAGADGSLNAVGGIFNHGALLRLGVKLGGDVQIDFRIRLAFPEIIAAGDHFKQGQDRELPEHLFDVGARRAGRQSQAPAGVFQLIQRLMYVRIRQLAVRDPLP